MTTKGARCRRALALLLGGVVLSGCLDLGPGVEDETSAFAAGARPKSPPLSKTTLSGRIVVQGPDGYCIDRETLERLKGFAVLGSCNLLSGTDRPPYVRPAVMTVSVSAPTTATTLPNADELATAIGDHSVLTTQDRNGVPLVHLGDGGAKALPDGDPRHWRSLVQVGDRFVSLAAYAPRGSRIAGQDGGDLLVELARAITAANADRRAPAFALGSLFKAAPKPNETEPETSESSVKTDDDAKKSKKGLLARLFN